MRQRWRPAGLGCRPRKTFCCPRKLALISGPPAAIRTSRAELCLRGTVTEPARKVRAFRGRRMLRTLRSRGGPPCLDRLRDDGSRPISRDLLIEVACVITDPENLELIGDGIDLVISAPAAGRCKQMDPVVVAMHAESGLDARRCWLRPCRWPTPQAQVLGVRTRARARSCARRRCAAIPSLPTEASWPATCPSSTRYLHYRMVDVSSVKELARRWYPRAYYASPAKNGGHRALADILESVQELRYYRDADLRPAAGAVQRRRRGRSRSGSAG